MLCIFQYFNTPMLAQALLSLYLCAPTPGRILCCTNIALERGVGPSEACVLIHKQHNNRAGRSLKRNHAARRTMGLVAASERKYGLGLLCLFRVLRAERDHYPKAPGRYKRSMTMAMPWPPPMHREASPSLASLSFIAVSRVTTMRAPVHPTGWPMAIPLP